MSKLFSNLSRALNGYKISTPSFEKIQSLYNNNLQPDHLALRSFKSEGGVNKVKQQFTELNKYILGGQLEIPEKHLEAEWFYTRDKDLRELAPRIFISEIDETKLSDESQQIIKKYVNSNGSETFGNDLVCCENGCENCITNYPEIPPQISFEEYQQLSKESEYAGWTLVHGNQINHLALCVPDGTNLKQFTTDLESKGFIVNTIGGKIKTSSDGMLHQSSTMSDQISHSFQGQSIDVPGFFVEFVQRDTFDNGSVREGFEANNALHIFDSTNLIEKHQ